MTTEHEVPMECMHCAKEIIKCDGSSPFCGCKGWFHKETLSHRCFPGGSDTVAEPAPEPKEREHGVRSGEHAEVTKETVELHNRIFVGNTWKEQLQNLADGMQAASQRTFAEGLEVAAQYVFRHDNCGDIAAAEIRALSPDPKIYQNAFAEGVERAIGHIEKNKTRLLNADSHAAVIKEIRFRSHFPQAARGLKPGPHKWCEEHRQAPPCTICDYEDVPAQPGCSKDGQ